MTEDDIKNLELSDLYDMLLLSTKELIELSHSGSENEYEAKRQEVRLLQRIIDAKRAKH
jgi:hypothetical protein